MPLPYIKISLASAWVLTSILVGMSADVASAGGRIALAAFAILPALALLLLWNDPPQPLTERIRAGRR